MKGSTRRRARRGEEPTPKRATADARAREHGDQVRAWLADPKREKAKRKAERKARAKREKAGRGVDRVPPEIRNAGRYRVEWVHKHRAQRHPETGRPIKGLPYQNLDKRPSRRTGGRR